MTQKKQKPSERRDETEETAPSERQEDVARKGDEIEEELDRLDEIIDEALGEEEDEAERKAQEFVDGFKQEGGE